MIPKDQIARLEAELERLRNENLALRATLVRAGLALNHQRVLEKDIQQRRLENAA